MRRILHIRTPAPRRSGSVIEGLGGNTGTAEFGDNTQAHGWFAGDIACSTLVVGGDESAPAISVSGEFLRPALAG